MTRILCTLVLGISTFSAALAQQPQLLHTQASTQTADRGLDAALEALKKAGGKTWVGYSVPTNTPYRNGWTADRVTYLENESHRGDSTDQYTQQSHESDHALILLRVSDGRVDKLRSAAPDEPIDAGGQRFVWLDKITPEDSVATLRKLILAASTGPIADSGTFLLALHRSTAVLPALVSLTEAPNPEHIREQAAFWLGSARGQEGFLALQKMLRTSGAQDDAFRQKLTFDLTVSKDPAATAELIRTAHQDPSPAVRRQAQFWMATRGGKLVTASLRESAEDDPDAATRKQAVFSISRLPAAEGIPQLCQLAETSKYPEVRKQAVFWLGQSPDPRALDYLTKLLLTPTHP